MPKQIWCKGQESYQDLCKMLNINPGDPSYLATNLKRDNQVEESKEVAGICEEVPELEEIVLPKGILTGRMHLQKKSGFLPVQVIHLS